ncbi:MAG: DUF4388 domain-containing protein [Myxococcales bacterium]|nr:MAG: DUF4388 domain-containing protein [Myxococcales bacterium]
MSNARKAALHLLNNEWSRSVWKQWLGNIFQPPVEPPMPASVASQPPSIAPEVVETAPPHAPSSSSRESYAAPKSTPAESPSARDVRRSELRARFDALSDRMMALEDGLDTLIRRSAHRDKLDRRSELQSVEMIDNVAVAGERQAAVLEGLLSTVTRLEHSMGRLEQNLARVERAVGERRRDSHYPTGSHVHRAPPSTFPEFQAAPRSTRHSDVEEVDHDEGSGINGNLSEVSLATVMAMLEIERHTGRLKVATEEGMLASFELAEGSVVSSRLSENDVDPLHTLRTALCWKQGRFWFRPQPAEAPFFPPRSIGSLLLEATRQNDESFADVG